VTRKDDDGRPDTSHLGYETTEVTEKADIETVLIQ
jgi:hypothetical protein